MPQSLLRLFRRSIEFLPQERAREVPRNVRGIYVLYKRRDNRDRPRERYDVVYVGMAKAGRRGGVRGRLGVHQRRKGQLWTHFSVFQVWDNIHEDDVVELEGLLRHIYRRDSRANRLNIQRGFKKLVKLRENDLSS